MSLESNLFAVVYRAGKIFGAYTELFAGPVDEIFGYFFRKFVGAPPKPRPIDQRLARLEDAKAALAESLSAIEDLQRDAEASKREHARATAELAATLASKDDAERKLESVKQIIQQDVQAFQAVAGVTNIRIERVIGFISGVAASVVATIIWTQASRLF